jgi:hypothetical protein
MWDTLHSISLPQYTTLNNCYYTITSSKVTYSGIGAIGHLSFPDILWHPTKIYGSKVFLLIKIKPDHFHTFPWSLGV